MWVEEMGLAASPPWVGVSTSLEGIRTDCDLLLVARALTLALNVGDVVYTLMWWPVEAASVLVEALRLTEAVPWRCLVLSILVHWLLTMSVLRLLTLWVLGELRWRTTRVAVVLRRSKAWAGLLLLLLLLSLMGRVRTRGWKADSWLNRRSAIVPVRGWSAVAHDHPAELVLEVTCVAVHRSKIKEAERELCLFPSPTAVVT